MESLNIQSFGKLITKTRPCATAFVQGNEDCPDLHGLICFYTAAGGTQVVAEVFGLPAAVRGEEAGPFYAMHIHEGESCGSPAGNDPFADAKGHFNPRGKEHPMHGGDLPPLLGNDGYAYAAVYTGRFRPQDVVGRTVIIHRHGDDFHTQPGGASGAKLACGVITPVAREQ